MKPTTMMVAADPEDVRAWLNANLPKGMEATILSSRCNKAQGELGSEVTLEGGTAAEQVAFAGHFTVIVRREIEPYRAVSRYDISRRAHLYLQAGAE